MKDFIVKVPARFKVLAAISALCGGLSVLTFGLLYDALLHPAPYLTAPCAIAAFIATMFFGFMLAQYNYVIHGPYIVMEPTRS